MRSKMQGEPAHALPCLATTNKRAMS